MRIYITLLLSTMLQSCITTEVMPYGSACPYKDRRTCDIQIIKEACRETLNNYAYLRDHLKYEEYGALFTQNATFQIGEGSVALGRDLIVQALRDRGHVTPTRHLSQITRMTVSDTPSVEAVSYVNVYKVDESQIDTSPWIIGEYHDQLEMVDGQCLIRSRKVEIVLRTE